MASALPAAAMAWGAHSSDEVAHALGVTAIGSTGSCGSMPTSSSWKLHVLKIRVETSHVKCGAMWRKAGPQLMPWAMVQRTERHAWPLAIWIG